MTINTKDIEAGDIVTLRDGSRIVAYKDGSGYVCLAGWVVETWAHDGGRGRGVERHLDIIAIEKKPEDKTRVWYLAYYPNGNFSYSHTLEQVKRMENDSIGYIKLTINLTDKTKHKIEEVV